MKHPLLPGTGGFQAAPPVLHDSCQLYNTPLDQLQSLHQLYLKNRHLVLLFDYNNGHLNGDLALLCSTFYLHLSVESIILTARFHLQKISLHLIYKSGPFNM